MPEAPPEERLRERVHAHLDARRDPFDDARLARELAARPRVERQVRALVGALPARARRLRPWAFAAAAALVLLALPVALRRAPSPPLHAATVTLEVVRGAPETPRGAVRRLEPRPVLHWTFSGERP